MPTPITIFFSYAHEDTELCLELDKALRLLKHQELIETWLDQDMRAGQEWETCIETHLNTANVILLLLSNDFFASDFCWKVEAPRAMERHEAKEARVIPIVLRPCIWAGSEYGKLQALPSEGKPITSKSWESQDEALMNVAEGIRLVAEECRAKGLAVLESSIPEKTVQLRQTTENRAIWNVPIRKNRNFVGRDGLLDKLKNSLKQEHIQALVGLGGIGKSQIAAEFAYQNASQYQAVWWIDAEDQRVLGNEFAELAKHLSLVEPTSADQELMMKAVQQWLEQHENWLLIFVNASGPEAVSPWLPRQLKGHILITSRNPNFNTLANTVQVPILNKEDAIQFLLLRSGQADRRGAGELAEVLGYLPLALEQAGAYLEETRVPITEYRALFERRAPTLLAEGQSLEYEKTVGTTWGLNITEVRGKSLEADGILNLCAFLGAEAIPLVLFEGDAHKLCPQLSEELSDDFVLNRALASLRRFSLVDVKDNNLLVNRLVQTVVRTQLDKEAQGIWAEGAVKIVSRGFVFDENDSKSWSTCAHLLPHVLVSSKHAEDSGVAQGVVGALLNETGAYLRRRAQFAEAKAILERSRFLTVAHYGNEHEEVAKVLNNLGRVHRDLGQLHEARDLFQQALTILDNLSGAEPLLITDVLDNLGVIMERLDQTEQASEIFYRELAIHESLQAQDQSRWATCLNNSGMVLQKLGDLAEARKRYEQALKMFELVHGPDHPNIAFNLDKLAGVLQEIQETEGGYSCASEALANYQRALTILETHYGADHPQLGNLANNLGNLLRKMERFQEAREYLERALTINTKALGSDNPLVAMNLTNIALLLRDEGEKEKASSLFRQAHDVFRSHWGEENETTKQVKGFLDEIVKSQ